MQQDFHDYYSTLPNAELLRIQAEHEKYQPEAVATAIAILQSRNVGPEDHQALEAIRQAELEEKERRNEKIQVVNGFIKKAMDTASPETPKTAQQELILVCAGLTIFFLLGLPNEYRHLRYVTVTGNFNLNSFLIIASLIVNPILIYLLYKRKRAGWNIAAIFYTVTFVMYARSAMTFISFSGLLGRTLPSTSAFIVTAVVTAAILYYINSERFIRHYQVSTKRQFTIVILSTLGGLVITSL